MQGNFTFPSGVTPGFDPNILPGRTRLLAVANNGNLTNILTGLPSSLTGTPSPGVNSHIGPTLNLVVLNQKCSFAGNPATAETLFTMAAMVFLTSVGSTDTIIGSSSTTAGNFGLQVTSSTGVLRARQVGGLFTFASTIALAINVPYFVAVSCDVTATANFIAVDLRTGATFTSTVATAGSSLTSDGTYTVGTDSGSNTPAYRLAAAAVSMGALASPAALTKLAADPWQIWYPQ